MIPLILLNRLFTLYFGLFFSIGGIVGSLMQVFMFIRVSYYRKTPCTFYFMIAAIHECGLFITAIAPYAIAAGLDVDMARTSVVWCKLRYFFASGFGFVSSTCTCLATIDQFLITSHDIRLRQWSTIRNAYRACLSTICVWWLHATLWLYFQDMSPVTHTCIYKRNVFLGYTSFVFCFGTCIIPILIMTIFGFLTYENIRKTIVLSRLRIDRQFTIIVFIQVLLTLIGLSPYATDLTYVVITKHVQKTEERKNIESLVANITYLFCSLAYGVSNFYIITQKFQ